MELIEIGSLSPLSIETCLSHEQEGRVAENIGVQNCLQNMFQRAEKCIPLNLEELFYEMFDIFRNVTNDEVP